MKSLKSLTLAVAAAFVSLSVPAFAGLVTLPNPANQDRTAWLDSAVAGAWGNAANPDATLVGAAFDPDPWTNEGERTGNGSDGWLTVNLTSGSWGDSTVEGTWGIAPAFWSTYGAAVISMHVGQGGGNPDYFLWLITPNETSGTFGLTRNSGGGGGLSNLKLWGAGTPGVSVPDGASTLALLGLGLVALVGVRSRLARK